MFADETRPYLQGARLTAWELGREGFDVTLIPDAAAPFLRSALGRILHVRRIPELRFREDRSYEGAARIEQVLSEGDPVV